MKNLAKKIQKTRLFSDPQRVELLVLLESANEADKRKLEAVIDEFDSSYAAAMAKHSAKMQSLLGHAVKDMDEHEKAINAEAIAEMKVGLALLTPSA